MEMVSADSKKAYLTNVRDCLLHLYSFFTKQEVLDPSHRRGQCGVLEGVNRSFTNCDHFN